MLASSIWVTSLHPGVAATVNLTGSDPENSSSFNSEDRWSNGLAPSAGNQYFVNGFNLRTPATGNSSYTFVGGSLTISNNGSNLGVFLLKNAATATFNVSNLILAGGYINNASSAGVTTTLAGNLSVNASGGNLWINNGSLDLNSTTTLNGRLNIYSGVTLSASTFNSAGNLSFNSGGSLWVTDASFSGTSLYLNFVQNQSTTYTFALNGASAPFINASAPASASARRSLNFDGKFKFDLTGLIYESGDTWSIVNVATVANPAVLSHSYGANFTVDGFTKQSAGLWLSNDGGFQFSEATGVLTAINVVPEPSSTALFIGSIGILLLRHRHNMRRNPTA